MAKIANFLRLHFLAISRKDLSTKKPKPDIEKWPESLGVMLEFQYIYRKSTHTDRLLDQSSYNPTSHRATPIRTLTRRVQLVCDSPDSLQDENDYLNNAFSKNKYITIRTLLDGTLTVTLIPTRRPKTLPLLRQRLHRTSEAPLKQLHVYYNLTIYVLHTNR